MTGAAAGGLLASIAPRPRPARRAGLASSTPRSPARSPRMGAPPRSAAQSAVRAILVHGLCSALPADRHPRFALEGCRWRSAAPDRRAPSSTSRRRRADDPRRAGPRHELADGPVDRRRRLRRALRGAHRLRLHPAGSKARPGRPRATRSNVTHFSGAWPAPRESRRALLDVAILASMLAFFAAASSWRSVAAPAPVFAAWPSGVALFPAVVHRRSLLTSSPRTRSAREHEGDHAVWPLVRFEVVHDLRPPARSRRRPVNTRSAIAGGRGLPPARLVWRASLLDLAVAAVVLMHAGRRARRPCRPRRPTERPPLAPRRDRPTSSPRSSSSPSSAPSSDSRPRLGLVIAVAFVRWAEVARLVRAEMLDRARRLRGRRPRPRRRHDAARLHLRHVPERAG